MAAPGNETITPVQLERLREEHALSEAEILDALQPEHLAPCYGFVSIDPYPDTPPPPVIRYWRQNDADGWEMAGAGGREPSLPEG